MNPSSSAQNPISQPLKEGKSQLSFYHFTTLFLVFLSENRFIITAIQFITPSNLIFTDLRVLFLQLS